jgi:hypothetical protein
MNECSPLLPGGINKSCVTDLKEIKNIIITTEAAYFTSLANAASVVQWKTKLQTDLSVYAPLGINDYEPTTDDPNIVTMPATGRKAVTNTPVPSGIFRLMSNFCDYKELLNTLKGGVYRVILVDSNGNIYGTMTSAGYFKGFVCTINAITKGMPLKEVANNFSLWVNFLNYDEFLAGVSMSLSWSPTIELTENAPVGLSMLATGAYSVTPGTITVQINTRCGTGYTGLTAADFEVIESNNLASVAITTATDSGAGAYTLTIQKGSSPISLAAGDYVIIRVKKLATTVVTHLSSRLTINA